MNLLAQITSNDNLLLGVITTAGGAMAGAIVHLYFRDATKGKELVEMVSAELVECKTDREELRKLYWQLQSQVNHIKRDQ